MVRTLVALQVGGLHGEGLAPLQSGDTHELRLALALALGPAVFALAGLLVVFGLGVGGDNALVVAQDDLVEMTYWGMTGVLPPPPGASTTKVGTQKPEVWPRRASMISMPLLTGVRKCSRPMDRSHW